jgi:hypothetical protein
LIEHEVLRVWCIFTFRIVRVMDRNTALTLLGIDTDTTQEDLMDKLDAETFAVRDHFIRQPVIPVLFRSRVDRLMQLSDIANTLGVDPLGTPVELPQLLPLEGGALNLAETHLENLLRLRTSMAGTLDPDVLARFGTTMATLQTRYMEAFVVATEGHPGMKEERTEVPAREECPWEELLAELRSDSGAHAKVKLERDRMLRLLDREVAN